MAQLDAAGLLSRTGPHFNGWVSLPEPTVAEAMALAGFDSLTLDFQHGLMTVEGMMTAIAGLTTTAKPAIVRIPVGELGLASRALDAGAAGVICPMVNSAADARAFADAMKYPPVGRRSWGPHRALALSGLNRTDYLHGANAATMAFAMVETEEALDNLDAILGTDGIDGIYIGPNDLCVSLTGGRAVDPGDEAVLRALADVQEAAARHEKPVGIFANNSDFAHDYSARGFPFISLGTDIAFLRARAEQALAEARGETAPSAARPPY